MKKSHVAKRSIVIKGHKTSVSLEDAFHVALKEIAARRGLTLSEMVALIDANRTAANLSSALRLFVLAELENALFIKEHFSGQPSAKPRAA